MLLKLMDGLTVFHMRFCDISMQRVPMRVVRSGSCTTPETHLIPLALAAAAETGPELHVFGSDHSTADGTCIRDYVHVNDIADAHVLALRHLLTGKQSETLNLGTGDGYSIKQVLACIQGVTGRRVRWREAPRRIGDPPSLVADPSRAYQVLGWRPQRTLEQIVSTAWGWIESGRARWLVRFLDRAVLRWPEIGVFILKMVLPFVFTASFNAR